VTNIIDAPLVIIDANGKIDYANQPFSEWLEAGNVRYRELRQTLEDALIRESARKYELQVADKYFVATSNPFFSEEQDFKGAVILFHDITDLKKYQSLQKDFFGNASHELKTPISAIKGCAEILLAGGHDEATLTEFLTIIQDENNRLERLVQDLLLINRYDFDQIKLQYQEICLNELMTECVLQVLNMANLKGQKIHLEAEESIIFCGDYVKLQQSFLNLLTNAIHYSDNGTTINIILRKTSSGRIRIKVRDQGCGIPKRDLPHIFERFYRVDKARSRHTGGSGLGLSIAQSIIEAHKGSIRVESTINKGTTFTIIL
jgi:two-component system phosphate regulon sensor histidine kinase PhoR